MGGRGAFRGRRLSPAEIEAHQWSIKCNMDKDEARVKVNELLKNKTITTPIYDEAHSTGLIKFNSSGRSDILSNAHSRTSEHKWIVQKFQSDYDTLNVNYAGYEELRADCHNYAKKVAKKFTGFNKYEFEYMGKRWRIKTAIIGDNWFEQPYFVGEI